jgi:predicted RND superfamily exporter protein
MPPSVSATRPWLDLPRQPCGQSRRRLAAFAIALPLLPPPKGAFRNMSDLLLRVALFAERHYRAVLITTAVLVLASTWLVSRMRFDPDILGLLPKNDPAVETFRETLDEFGGLDVLLVVVRVPEGAVIDPYQQFVSTLGQEVETLAEVDYAEFRIGEPANLLRTFFPNAFFFLDAKEREEVAERLSPERIDARVAELRQNLTTPQSLALKELLLLDPLGLSEVLLKRLESGRGALGVDWTSGYYLSKDRRLLLMLVRPKGAAQDIPFGRNLIAAVEGKIAKVQADWRTQGENLGELAATPPEVVLGGSYVTAVADADMIQSEVLGNSILSTAFVLIFFYYAFRRPELLLYAFVPLGSAMVFTFAIFALTGDVLSSATSGCAAMMVGLADDFVIVTYGRYADERRRGSTANEALRLMTGSCGKAVVVGGVTTAVTFFSFALTKFQGLRQMGLITGTGILVSVVCVLVILPALLAWTEARHRRKTSPPLLVVRGLGADHLVKWSWRNPKVAWGIGLLLMIAGAAALPHLKFESSIANLRPDGNKGIQVQAEVSRHFGTNFRYMMLVVKGKTLEETLDLAAEASEGAKSMVDNGDLQRVDSIGTLLPAPKKQRETLAWLAEQRVERLDFAKIRQTFLASLEKQGIRAEPFEPAIELLGHAINAERPLSLADLDGLEGAKRLLSRYLHQKEDHYKSVVYLYPEGDRWKSDPPPAADVLANRLGPNVQLTGVNTLSRSLRRQVWFDAAIACILGFTLVTLLLYLDFREIRATILTLAPLAIGALWIALAMVLLGLDVNFMNIFVSTMIIGIGTDYAVHMLHRYREVRELEDNEVAEHLAETGRSVAIAALTTMIGFGSLSYSHYPGLRSIGYASLLGAGCTAIIAITLLPAYLKLVRHHLD